ncbi:DUF2141 domain-containing protein [Altererythrobacter aquiaggeris]|uniref:DUF2141 domain-containing protein n=1 Tax=Aestuarierythrobacter aquiaggeris TaxID=1898396 RepID=UPI003019AD5A
MAAICAAPLLASAVPAPAAVISTGIDADKTADVTVRITDVRNEKGVIRACMTANSSGFPKTCRGDARAVKLAVAARSGAVLTFRNVRPGTYAIALLHDENDNGKADRALSMIPKEGFGFSRDAKVMMAPPKFADAAFDVAGKPVSQTIRLRYMF